jgi:signal peptidase I
MFAIYKVAGNSMLPQIKDGDYVFLLTLIRFTLPLPGMTVIFDQPEYGLLLKQVSSVDRKNKTMTLQGLNSFSVNIHQIGEVPFSCLKGCVLWKLSGS